MNNAIGTAPDWENADVMRGVRIKNNVGWASTVRKLSDGNYVRWLRVCPVCKKPKVQQNLFKCFAGTVNESMLVRVKCDCEINALNAEKEAQERMERERRIRKRREKCFESRKLEKTTFDTITVNAANKPYVDGAKRYVDGWKENASEKYGMIFGGTCGRGKTTIAACIANALIDMGVSVKMVTASKLIRELTDAPRQERETIKRELKSVGLLIIDDLGGEYRSDYSTSKIYEILDERFADERPVIVTTNYDAKTLRTHLTGQYESLAAYHLLVNNCTSVVFNTPPFTETEPSRPTFKFFNGEDVI